MLKQEMSNLEHVEGEVGAEVSEAEDVVAEVVVHKECWKVISVRGMCQMNMMCLSLSLNLSCFLPRRSPAWKFSSPTTVTLGLSFVVPFVCL